MAIPEAGRSDPSALRPPRVGPVDAEPASVELTDETLAMRRLGEADELVRRGLASVDGAAVRLAVDDAVTLTVPLPPAPLAPRLALAARPGDPALAPGDVEDLLRLVAAVLPGALDLELEEDALEVVWQPAGAHAEAEATRRARAVAEHLARTRAQARAAAAWPSALAELDRQLTERRQRGARLARAFRDHALVRLPALGVMHLLAHRTDPRTPDAPRLIALQRDADLLAPAAGRGLYVALRLPEWGPAGRLAHLADALAALLELRYDVPAARSDALEMLGEWAEPHHTLLLATYEQTERPWDAFLWQVVDVLRFTDSLAQWVGRGHNPFELLGVEDPGPDAVAAPAPSVHAPAPGQHAPPPPTRALEPEPPDEPAEDDTAVEAEPAPMAREPAAPAPSRPARPGPAAPEAPLRREPPPRPPQPSRTEAAPSPTPGPGAPDEDKGPTAWGVPIPRPQRGARRVAPIDSMTAREVVKRLGMQEEADVDVFLSHPGYNPQKTIDIMSLALAIEKDEARRIVESAPALVVGPVTRTRAARIKTILEGTGSMVQVIPSGQQDEDDTKPEE